MDQRSMQYGQQHCKPLLGVGSPSNGRSMRTSANIFCWPSRQNLAYWCHQYVELDNMETFRV